MASSDEPQRAVLTQPRQLLSRLKVEDWLVGGWVALVSPLIFKASGDKGPFDPGQPLEGLLRLVAVLGVLVCIAARRPATEAKDASILNRASVGPFFGGLLLVLISGFTALETPDDVVLIVLAGSLVLMAAVRFAAPPIPVAIRRAMVSPFVMVASGLYWNVIEAVTGTPGFTVARQHPLLQGGAALAVFGFLAVFSAVYYAMLVYGPRQAAEREGGPVEWVLRYVVFLISIALGIGWLAVIA